MRLHVRDASSSAATNPYNIGPALAGLIVPWVISTLIVLGRVYSRSLIVGSWGFDDTSIMLAWMSSVACIVLLIFRSVLDSRFDSCDVYFYSAVITYTLGIFLTKASILLFYLRILPPAAISSGCGINGSRIQLWNPRLLSQVTLVLLTCYSIPLIITSALSCAPQPPGDIFFSEISCVPFLPFLYANAVLNAVSDAWLLTLILPSILSLQLMRTRQKTALAALFSIATLLVIVADIIRTVYISWAIRYEPFREWNYDTFGVWTGVELCTGVACASIPGVIPFLRMVAPKVVSSIMGDSSGSGSGISGGAGAAGSWKGSGLSGMGKSRGTIEEDTGAILELNGASKNQSVIRSFAKGGCSGGGHGVGSGGRQTSLRKKVAWYSSGGGGGGVDGERKRSGGLRKGNSGGQHDNESQEDVLASRSRDEEEEYHLPTADEERRPQTATTAMVGMGGMGIMKTSEVVIRESRIGPDGVGDYDWSDDTQKGKIASSSSRL